MDLDEPELSELLPHESTEAFIQRINLVNRVIPILRDLVAQRFSLVVESDRRTSNAASLTSDFVLEFGDARVRLILTPGNDDPVSGGELTVSSLTHYMLDVPDTDAIAVVADNFELSTWLYDIYALNSEKSTIQSASLPDALGAYFEDAVHPIEFPNFREAMVLPSLDQLQESLERYAANALIHIRQSRARIPEKVAAIGRIASSEENRLAGFLVRAIRGGDTDLSMILEQDPETDA